MEFLEKKDFTEINDIWINPLGGLGDTIILSSVLKLVHDKYPQKNFHLARRNKYLPLLQNHSAIKSIGYPPKDAFIISSNYWGYEQLGGGTQRPFQILARVFGLETPIEEKLYIPVEPKDDFLLSQIPFQKKNVLIVPASDSPRKMMHPMFWHQLVEQLTNEGIFVAQAGKIMDLYIKGAYSLLGLTNTVQFLAMIKKFDVIVTVDNYAMHAAKLFAKPTVALWGPTSCDVYGYPEQTHINANLEVCHLRNECLGPELGHNYGTPCPLNEHHCMNTIDANLVLREVKKLL